MKEYRARPIPSREELSEKTEEEKIDSIIWHFKVLNDVEYLLHNSEESAERLKQQLEKKLRLPELLLACPLDSYSGRVDEQKVAFFYMLASFVAILFGSLGGFHADALLSTYFPNATNYQMFWVFSSNIMALASLPFVYVSFSFRYWRMRLR